VKRGKKRKQEERRGRKDHAEVQRGELGEEEGWEKSPSVSLCSTLPRKPGEAGWGFGLVFELDC